MYKHLFVMATMCLLQTANSSKAATITQTIRPSAGVSTENEFDLLFNFQPLTSVPGQVTAVQLFFTGSITPGIRAVTEGGPVNKVTLYPIRDVQQSGKSSG